MFLTVTLAGKAKENEALTAGLPLPKIEKMIVGEGPAHSQPSLVTALAAPEIAQHEVQITTVEKLSDSTIQLNGEVGSDVDIHIREIGLLMEDGTLYAYGIYQPFVPLAEKQPDAFNTPEEYQAHLNELQREADAIAADPDYAHKLGGLKKGAGFAFSLYVILSRDDVESLEVSYAPLDVGALAQKISDDATALINTQIDGTVFELLIFQSQIAAQNLALQAQISTLKGQSE
ncbi:phage tail protein [Epibacterium ulvae]|uniref:phage tail-collar fiber domain-containing protein n=1 Tax=Epibacterium ulvae TaxID=1156985 RepID=UPI002490E24D|nr:phage tail protein [Epibacterium ulvae]